MSVAIHLDNPHAFYTNLDFISGKVVFALPRDETIQAITVKLEGESKTLLRRPAPNREAPRSMRDGLALENHKILYRTKQVFPIQDQPPAMGTSYMLRAGTHEYPFRFKIPFNNSCHDMSAPGSNMGIGFGGIKLMDLPRQMQYRHVKKSLPPSLSGFPGEAEIKYYVKVTVARPGIWKENRRSAVGFKFSPIEPPRPHPSEAETFARRAHAFNKARIDNSRKGGMFGRKTAPLSNNPPAVIIDARLPSPAILTCNETIPLRILVKKDNDSPESIFLIGLQIDLIGYTSVRAMEVQRTEVNTWCVTSLARMARPVGSPGDPAGTQTVLDSSLWDHIKLPHTVTPSFQACNLIRKYELEVKVTLGFGAQGNIQPETQLLPLRLPVEVFSGIAPPTALLEAMAANPVPTPPRPAQAQSRPPPATHVHPTASAAPPSDPLYPPQLSGPGGPPPEDAPPSYEDAMADSIAPIDGPRIYSGITNENAPSEVGDEGGGGEKSRLFR